MRTTRLRYTIVRFAVAILTNLSKSEINFSKKSTSTNTDTFSFILILNQMKQNIQPNFAAISKSDIRSVQIAH